MFVRLTFCKFTPESVNEALQIYKNEVVPIVRKQKGNIGVRMLEPIDKADDFISVTEWSTQADADAYESSGMYKSMVGKIVDLVAKPPVLRAYNAEEKVVMAH